MIKIKKIALGLGTLALFLGIFGAMVNNANAYRGDPALKGPNYSAERKAAIEKAFASNDYTAWKALMQNRGKIAQIINEDNFAKFVEARNLAKNGDMAGAQKIRQELGLGLNNGKGLGRGNCVNY